MTKTMAIDIYDDVASNICAVAATLEALRAVERHGGGQILDRAFAGFDALPAPGNSSRTWQIILALGPNPTRAEAERNYKALRSATHPDKPGGDAGRFHEVEQAWKQAQRALPA